MDLTLGKDAVAERILSFTPNNYQYIYGIMKGIALGVGALVVVSFSSDPMTQIPRLSLWIASLAAVMVSHAKTARGILLTSFRYSSFDTVLPLALGTVECLLFAVLQISKDRPDLWYWWYALFPVHIALAALVPMTRKSLTDTRDFTADLQQLIQKYHTWLQRDVKNAAKFAVIAAVTGIIVTKWVVPTYPGMVWWQWVVGGSFAVGLVSVIREAESERREIVAYLKGLP